MEYKSKVSELEAALISTGAGGVDPNLKAKQLLNDTIFNIEKKYILEAYEYACDPWKEKLIKKFPEFIKIEKIYKLGDRFKYIYSDDIYMLSAASYINYDGATILAAVISNTRTGALLSYATKIKNFYKIII